MIVANSDGNGRDHSAIDAAMMKRCIRLAEDAIQRGELPFATLICKGNDVVATTINQVVQNADVTRHAELIALSEAQRTLGTKDLSACTLYTIVEPCAMCSFAIRETRIGRVVFSIKSPMMGGLSKWNVLRDTEVSHALPEVFGSVPEVIAGLSCQEAEAVWSKWNPLFWSAIKLGGYLGGNTENGCEQLPSIPPRRGLFRRLFALHSHPRA
ncbi:MAG TPA: nucleoside deaminase [Pseudolabrys sp.]